MGVSCWIYGNGNEWGRGKTKSKSINEIVLGGDEMKISKLIEELLEIKEEHGDIEVEIDNGSDIDGVYVDGEVAYVY